jgi:homoserine O-acetyltransferase
MRVLVQIIVLCLLSSMALADTGLQRAVIGDLRLDSGEVLRDCEIAYRTAGTLNADKSNVIVFPTWFTGSSGDLVNYELIGPGKLADTDRFYVIAIDALANGVSTSPSNSTTQAGTEFPVISIDDMVRSQHILLTQHLGLDHVMAVVGISMGGMQAFQWMGQYPEFMDQAVPIDGSPKLTSYDLLQWHMHTRAIEIMQNAGVPNAKIMEFLASANLLTLWTPEYFVENVTPEEFPEFLAREEKSYARMDASDYATQLRAIMAHDVFADHAKNGESYPQNVKAKVLVVGTASDLMVNPTPGKSLSATIGASYSNIDSNCGHLGTSCKSADVIAVVNAFLK